jgi:hypothetical protein
MSKLLISDITISNEVTMNMNISLKKEVLDVIDDAIDAHKIMGGGDGNGGGSDGGGCFPPDSDTTTIRVISHYDTL